MTPPVPPINPSTQTQTSPETLPVPPINTPSEFEVVKQQLAQLAGMVGNLVNVQNRPAPAPAYSPPPPLTREDMENNPQLLLDRIAEEQRRQNEPINQFRITFERTSKYNSVKNQVRNANAQINRLWAQIEPALDNIFGNGQVEPDPNLVYFNAQAIFGNLVASNPTLLTSAAPLNPAPVSNMIPPSGSVPPGAPKPPTRELTENERFLARKMGVTDAEYLQGSEGTSILIPASSTRTK